MEITISTPGAERVARALTNLDKAMPSAIKRGMNKAGGLLLKDMRRKISGPGFTRNPARSSPYPGIASGEMFRTMFSSVSQEGDAIVLRVGPNVHYAIYQEYGTKHIPARPFVGPTWRDKGDSAIDKIQDAISDQVRKA